MLFGGKNSAINKGPQLFLRCFLFLSFAVFAAAGCKEKHAVDLKWSAPVNSSEPIAGYNIYRSADEGLSYQKLNSAPVQGTAYTDGQLQSGHPYIYMIKSVDARGIESRSSNSMYVTIP